MRRACAALVALCVIATAAADPPKLAVLIVVDQMRADYVDRFQGDWTAGLKRLVTKGAWFSRAAYPYLDTVTCAGHATIGTGAFPSTPRRLSERLVRSRADALDHVHAGRERQGRAVRQDRSPASESARQLLIPTFADEMHVSKGSHVVSLSLKARSAIMLAGHSGDAVTWLSESLDGWTDVHRLQPGAQSRKCGAFVAAHPIEADFGKTWKRLLPADRYADPDAGLGEAPPLGWTRKFPHVLNGKPGDTPPARRTTRSGNAVRSPTPISGEWLPALVESMQLGKHDTTDVLARQLLEPRSRRSRDSVRAARKSATCTRISIARSARCSIGSTRSSAPINTSSRSAPITA